MQIYKPKFCPPGIILLNKPRITLAKSIITRPIIAETKVFCALAIFSLFPPEDIILIPDTIINIKNTKPTIKRNTIYSICKILGRLNPPPKGEDTVVHPDDAEQAAKTFCTNIDFIIMLFEKY